MTLLNHQNPTVRLAAFSLIAAPTAKLTSFPTPILGYLRLAIPCYHDEVDPEYRREFIKVLTQMWTRLCWVLRNLYKTSQQHQPSLNTSPDPWEKGAHSEEQVAQMVAHVDFVRWYLSFLFLELQPTAPYQRHFAALNILYVCYFHESEVIGSVQLAESLNDAPALERLLLDLATDAFDDIRSMATQCLNLGYRKGLFQSDMPIERKSTVVGYDSSRKDKLLKALKRAEARMQATGRADHADGVGRLYAAVLDVASNFKGTQWHDTQTGVIKHLLATIKADLATGPGDRRRALVSAPFHGHMIALR